MDPKCPPYIPPPSETWGLVHIPFRAPSFDHEELFPCGYGSKLNHHGTAGLFFDPLPCGESRFLLCGFPGHPKCAPQHPPPPPKQSQTKLGKTQSGRSGTPPHGKSQKASGPKQNLKRMACTCGLSRWGAVGHTKPRRSTRGAQPLCGWLWRGRELWLCLAPGHAAEA